MNEVIDTVCLAQCNEKPTCVNVYNKEPTSYRNVVVKVRSSSVRVEVLIHGPHHVIKITCNLLYVLLTRCLL